MDRAFLPDGPDSSAPLLEKFGGEEWHPIAGKQPLKWEVWN